MEYHKDLFKVLCYFKYTFFPLVILLENTGLVFIVDYYADDTQLYISTRPDEISKLAKLTECVKNLKDWMTNNSLLLNSDKTDITYWTKK